MALIDFFDRGWLINPHGVAYRHGDASWTFDEAGALSCRIAHALITDGVGIETKAAVLSPNDPLAWICVLGIWRAGGAWVPMNPKQPVEDNTVLLDRFDVEVVFYAPSVADQVARMRDVLPKGVMNTHRSFSTMVVHQMLALTYPAGAPVVNLAAAPMTHTAGLFSLQATARGGTTVVISDARPDTILDAIEQHRVTELFLPPTVVYRILERLEHRSVDTSSLRYVMYAAAPMSLEKLRQGIERLGPVFIEGYGQMEGPAGITFLRPDEHFLDGAIAPDERLSSCGRPYPLVTVAILDPETGAELGAGETGEICVRGDLVMKGYYKDPERTAATVVDGWLRTGDLGHLDEGGYLHLTDRRKDMIISGGFNVYPGEVEQVLWSHPAVQDCAVVGAPHPDWGEAGTAVG